VLKTVEALYQKKDYQEALKVLLTNRREISPGIWNYNIGTVYGKLGNDALARFHFLKAEAEGFVTEEVVTNKKLVEKNLDVEKLESPISLSDYLIKGGLVAGEGIFTFFALVFALIALWRILKKKALAASMSLAGMALALLLMDWWVDSWNRVVVVGPQLTYDGPSAIFQVSDELPRGVLLVTEEKDGWSKIIYPSRFQGWMKRTGVMELE
jgi:hypothetical protein